MNNKLQLNALVTQALLDSEFQKSILNGKRKECLQMFDLSQAEIDTLLAIDADGIDHFIRQIDAMTHPPTTNNYRGLSIVANQQVVLAP
jgi:hypothetical protein